MEAYQLEHTGAELDKAIAGAFVTGELTARKDGVYEPGDGADGFSKVTVRVFSEDDDVCFWDYDGTLVYSCTLAEAQTMTMLPDPPDHSKDDIPLTFVEWNWLLKEINHLDRKMDIGAMYRPTDGKTHFSVRLTPKTGLTLTLGWRNNDAAATRVIDWGDGMVEETTPETAGDATLSHTYADYGTYHCSFDSGGYNWNPGNGACFIRESTGCACMIGKLIFDPNVTWDWPEAQGGNFYNSQIEYVVPPPTAVKPTGSVNVSPCVKHINLPRTMTGGSLGSGASMKHISLPMNYVDGSDYCLRETSIKRLRLPAGFIGSYRFQFYDCRVLEEIEIPDGYTSVSMREFMNCKALRKLVIPATVTGIAAEAFSGAGILDYYFYPDTPPTLGDTNAFNGIASGAIIHVKPGSLEAYRTATNWATYADYMAGDIAE